MATFGPRPTNRARNLRNNPTDAEKRLWSVLRNRRLNGIKFSRQIPVGPYICDFVSRELRVVIELDGGQHATDARDQGRTTFIEEQDFA